MDFLFLYSRILQLKNEIYNFEQLHSEAFYESWLGFIKNLMNIPNHRITGRTLLELFYISLNDNNKAVVDTSTDEEFMSIHWKVAEEI